MADKKLWKDYYAGPKPHCWGCLKKGIAPNQYAFCSPNKEPTQIIINENKEKVGVFNNLYKCTAYHWTKFQGQGKIKQ